jgi:hypothetical protein
VPAATVQGEKVSVNVSCPPERPCVHQLSGAGTQATVTAPGFKSVPINWERETDDCGNTLTRHVEVVLVPEANPAPSTSRLVRSSTCQ